VAQQARWLVLLQEVCVHVQHDAPSVALSMAGSSAACYSADWHACSHMSPAAGVTARLVT
jgi:hypothetical protein